MKTMQKNRRLLVLLLVAVMLIPMLAVTAYASPKYAYNFNFNAGSNSVTGTKTDYAYSAGASVLGGNFNGGYVRFQLYNPTGGAMSYESNSVWGITSSCPVYYFSSLSFNGNTRVKLVGNGYAGIANINGNFVP